MTEFRDFRAMPFSPLRASSQADQLGALVRDNADWLQASVYSGAVTRFGWQRPPVTGSSESEQTMSAKQRLAALLPPKANAMRHVLRLALFHSTVHNFVLEAQPADSSAAAERTDATNWRAVGVGTVTRGVNAILDGHPGFPSYGLTDVDYWLDAQAENTGLHRLAAQTMIAQARKNVRQHENQTTTKLLASIVPNIKGGRDEGLLPHQPIGFMEFMNQPYHMEAVPLNIVGDDPYGVAKGVGRSLHIFTLEVPTAGPLEL